MTFEEIQNLKAGKETDALVHEHMMRLPVTYIASSIDGNTIMGSAMALEDCKEFCIVRNFRSKENNPYWIFEPKPYGNPCYSSKWKDSGTLVDRFRECGKFCCIKINYDHNYISDVLLYIANQNRHTPNIVITDPSFHLAVCKAALVAKFVYGIEIC